MTKNPDNSSFPDPPYPTDEFIETYRKMRGMFDICSQKAQEMEELMQDCEKVLDKSRCGCHGTDTQFMEGEQSEPKEPYLGGANLFLGDEGYYTIEDFMEDIQNELPQMDYFSTPYDKGSKDDILDRISHLSAMYSRFGYGARGYEWRKGYFNGITDEKEEQKNRKEEVDEEAKWATEKMVDIFSKSASKSESLAKGLEKQKIYTHEMYHANLRLQSKLDKAREFLSSWEDGDRSLDDEGTLWDTFNDFLEGKYDPRSGEWVESS